MSHYFFSRSKQICLESICKFCKRISCIFPSNRLFLETRRQIVWNVYLERERPLTLIFSLHFFYFYFFYLDLLFLGISIMDMIGSKTMLDPLLRYVFYVVFCVHHVLYSRSHNKPIMFILDPKS